jgi:hypothetical protein
MMSDELNEDSHFWERDGIVEYSAEGTAVEYYCIICHKTMIVNEEIEI